MGNQTPKVSLGTKLSNGDTVVSIKNKGLEVKTPEGVAKHITFSEAENLCNDE